MTEKNVGTVWPLLFSIELPVRGKDFMAGVAIDGNLLAIKEEEGVWIDSVQPGFLGEGDTDVRNAYMKFRQAIKEVMDGLAEDSSSFNDFEKQATRFFNAKDEEISKRWEAAVKEVKSGSITAPEALHTRDADSERGIQIVRIDEASHSYEHSNGHATPPISEDRTICRVAA